MKMTGRVVELRSGSDYADKRERVTVRLTCEGYVPGAVLIVPNEEGWRLDQMVEMELAAVFTSKAAKPELVKGRV